MRFNRFFMACFALCSVGVFLCGCERDYLWYDAGQKDGIYFLGSEDTIRWFDNTGKDWITVLERVEVLGFTTDYDRKVHVEVVDSLTSLPADRYSFEDTCRVRANQTFGLIAFSYRRSETDTNSIRIRLVENEHFRPRMNDGRCFILAPYKLSEPGWWKCNGFMFGYTWTPELHALVLRFYRNVEQLNPYVWENTLKPDLGEGLEKAGGKYNAYYNFWNPPYEILLRTWVARPLYDYLKEHPEEGDHTAMPDPYED